MLEKNELIALMAASLLSGQHSSLKTQRDLEEHMDAAISVANRLWMRVIKL